MWYFTVMKPVWYLSLPIIKTLTGSQQNLASEVWFFSRSWPCLFSNKMYNKNFSFSSGIFCNVLQYILSCVNSYTVRTYGVLSHQHCFSQPTYSRFTVPHRIINDRMEKYGSVFVFVSKYCSVELLHRIEEPSSRGEGRVRSRRIEE